MDVPLPGDALSGAPVLPRGGVTPRALLFGKLPAHGDFVVRGCDAAEQAGYDRWLSESLADAKAALGDDFEARYDAAPAWRFAVADGGAWLAGAIAPSLDSVGRRFPILVGCGAGDEMAAALLAQACEDAIYQAFAQSLTADELHAGLRRLAAQAAAPPRLPGWWSAGNGDFAAGRVEGERPAGLLGAMLGTKESA